MSAHRCRAHLAGHLGPNGPPLIHSQRRDTAMTLTLPLAIFGSILVLAMVILVAVTWR